MDTKNTQTQLEKDRTYIADFENIIQGKGQIELVLPKLYFRNLLSAKERLVKAEMEEKIREAMEAAYWEGQYDEFHNINVKSNPELFINEYLSQSDQPHE